MLAAHTSDANIVNLATRFSELLREEIGDDQLTQVVERNMLDYDRATCHSHDFSDANEVMLQAFKSVMDKDMVPSSDDDTETVNKAWSLAKSRWFKTDPVPSPRNHLTTMPDTVRIGSSQFPFTSYQDVSEAYCAARDATDSTASGRTGPLAPNCDLYSGGVHVGKVSYNGKVWRFDPKVHPHLRKDELVYDPYAADRDA